MKLQIIGSDTPLFMSVNQCERNYIRMGKIILLFTYNKGFLRKNKINSSLPGFISWQGNFPENLWKFSRNFLEIFQRFLSTNNGEIFRDFSEIFEGWKVKTFQPFLLREINVSNFLVRIVHINLLNHETF